MVPTPKAKPKVRLLTLRATLKLFWKYGGLYLHDSPIFCIYKCECSIQSNVNVTFFCVFFPYRRLCGFKGPHPPLQARLPSDRPSHLLSPYVSIPSTRTWRLPLWTPSPRPWQSSVTQPRAWPTGTAPHPRTDPSPPPTPPLSTPRQSSSNRKRTLSALPAPTHLTTSLPLRLPPPLCLGLPPSCPPLYPQWGWMGWGWLRVQCRRTDTRYWTLRELWVWAWLKPTCLPQRRHLNHVHHPLRPRSLPPDLSWGSPLPTLASSKAAIITKPTVLTLSSSHRLSPGHTPSHPPHTWPPKPSRRLAFPRPRRVNPPPPPPSLRRSLEFSPSPGLSQTSSPLCTRLSPSPPTAASHPSSSSPLAPPVLLWPLPPQSPPPSP